MACEASAMLLQCRSSSIIFASTDVALFRADSASCLASLIFRFWYRSNIESIIGLVRADSMIFFDQ